ncbi:MAG TPA: nicotinamide riboside transporter PnuC [Burkholderiaceae bacterium]|jgi:nicotinamide mononucleotide transporter|nr:nicotinamide riboside transporter PnuC [Burkholderiaceae bacterium]
MLSHAFTLWGSAVTWLEIVAFVLAFGCVAFNVVESHWGWPLAIVSSALYGWLFYVNRIYGDASLQVFFAATAAWGWWQWLFGRRAGDPAGARLQVARLRPATVGAAALVWLTAWLVLGALLDRFTDTDVPYLDAFPTAGSVIGQLLLARKYLENWWVWLVVNVASIALFSWKALWLTAVLYAVFLVLSAIGLRRWQKTLQVRP